jgi:addiction module HigA family antidote
MRKTLKIHPGEILQAEFLGPLGISQNKLSLEIRVPVHRVNEIIHGRRGITADTALRLSKYFGTTPGFWTNLQTEYNLREAREALKDELSLIRPRVAVSV